jgi:hypothetical protein
MCQWTVAESHAITTMTRYDAAPVVKKALENSQRFDEFQCSEASRLGLRA